MGEQNIFIIPIEFLNESETPLIQFLNEFFLAAREELPHAQLVTGLKWHIACVQNTYALNKDNPESYVTNMQIVKDLNTVLEARGASKRVFYFDDLSDDLNPSYFYAEKDLGLQLIAYLNDPPFLSYFDFEDRYCNRIINMKYVDSTVKKEAEYFKRMIPDF